jgi:hypothetical protein
MPVEGPDEMGICWPKCGWFRCGKQAIQYRGQVIWCTWLNDNCVGPSCSYAICARNKMLPDNRCGLLIKRATSDSIKPEDFKINVKLRGQLARRLQKEGDLF